MTGANRSRRAAQRTPENFSSLAEIYTAPPRSVQRRAQPSAERRFRDDLAAASIRRCKFSGVSDASTRRQT